MRTFGTLFIKKNNRKFANPLEDFADLDLIIGNLLARFGIKTKSTLTPIKPSDLLLIWQLWIGLYASVYVTQTIFQTMPSITPLTPKYE